MTRSSGTRRKIKVVPLFKKTYLAVIRNSVGADLFRNFYAVVDDEKKDILRNGELACAFFVSSILRMFDLLKENHCTVGGTVKDLKKSGWVKIKKPRPGCILVWEAIRYQDGKDHTHLGFYIGKGRAISNLSSSGAPGVHHQTFGLKSGKPVRKITAIYGHEFLG